MENKRKFLEFVQTGDFSKESINEFKEKFSLNDSILIKKAFKLLSNEIGSLDENLYYVYIITNCTKLLAILCDENNFDEENILINRIRIKKAREALLENYSIYRDEELLSAANRLDEIILDKSINLEDLTKLIKTLIDKKEYFNIIKKLLNTNKGVLLKDNNELFDYTFKKAMDSINKNTPDIYYYISLLKIFYSSKIDKEEYLKEINEKCPETNDFANEIYYLLHGQKRKLTKDQILTKYGVIKDLATIYISNPFCSTTDDYAFTIDTDGTNIRDDAISVKRDGNNYIVGIHITDPASFIEQNGIIDYQAKNNYSCKYLRDTTLGMLPNNIEQTLSLDKDNYRKVISMYVVFESTGAILNYYITENVIKIYDNLEFSQADILLKNSTNDLAGKLHDLYDLSNVLLKNNLDKYLYWDLKDNDSIRKEPIYYKSDIIISEFMVLYNHLLAKYACNSNIPYVYRTQSNAYLNDLAKKLDIKLDEEARKIINNIYLKGTYSAYPLFHNGLKLTFYSHSSSPLRRYPDLYNQFLLHYYIFKDIKFDFDSNEHLYLIDYFNQRSNELSLMCSEYSRALTLKKG